MVQLFGSSLYCFVRLTLHFVPSEPLVLGKLQKASLKIDCSSTNLETIDRLGGAEKLKVISDQYHILFQQGMEKSSQIRKQEAAVRLSAIQKTQ